MVCLIRWTEFVVYTHPNLPNDKTVYAGVMFVLYAKIINTLIYGLKELFHRVVDSFLGILDLAVFKRSLIKLLSYLITYPNRDLSTLSSVTWLAGNEYLIFTVSDEHSV